MNTSQREYGEGRPPIPTIDQPIVIFMINRTMDTETATDLDIYRATQGSWIIGEGNRNRAKYVLGVSHGVVRGAYGVEGWRRDPNDHRRWSFDGRPAPELGDVVGTSVVRLKAAQGASNPVRIFLDGIPPGD